MGFYIGVIRHFVVRSLLTQLIRILIQGATGLVDFVCVAVGKQRGMSTVLVF